MGHLQIGDSARPIEFDDRLLAHLRVVIFSKFRRHESFPFSWDHGLEKGSGRSSVWLTESIPIRFVFSGGKAPALNRTWLEDLLAASSTAAGLQITKEPEERAPSPG